MFLSISFCPPCGAWKGLLIRRARVPTCELDLGSWHSSIFFFFLNPTVYLYTSVCVCECEFASVCAEQCEAPPPLLCAQPSKKRLILRVWCGAVRTVFQPFFFVILRGSNLRKRKLGEKKNMATSVWSENQRNRPQKFPKSVVPFSDAKRANEAGVTSKRMGKKKWQRERNEKKLPMFTGGNRRSRNCRLRGKKNWPQPFF